MTTPEPTTPEPTTPDTGAAGADDGPSAGSPSLTRYGATRPQVAALLADAGQPRYRADQVYDGLWSRRAPLSELTELPAALRTSLERALPETLHERTRSVGDDGFTVKWLWECTSDGAQVETVLMRYPEHDDSRGRVTVCVSSQAGCAMACTFCATGQAGFERHLSTAEIVEQVVRAAHESPQRVSNVVFMGMGEPLANYDAVWSSVERLHGDLGLSARHITVSTVGVVPGIRRLAAEALPVTLAVSIHAPFDELRDTLVPLNRRYPVAELLDAAREFAAAKGRRITFEYTMLDGVNDTEECARALAALLRRFSSTGAHVNLIPYNHTSGLAARASRRIAIERFAERLVDGGVNATIRRNRGVAIDAACGQLRARDLGHAGAGTAVGPPVRRSSVRMAP